MSILGQVSAKALQSLAKGLSPYLNEVILEFEKGRLKCLEIDPANVIMIHEELQPSSCIGLPAETADGRVPLNVGMLNSILKDLEFEDFDVARFEQPSIMTIYRTVTGAITHRFEFEMELEQKENRIPDLHYDIKFTLPCWLWREILTASCAMSESLKISCMKGHVSFSAKGDGCKYASGNITENTQGVSISATKNCEGRIIKCKYSLEYLHKTLELFNKHSIITFEFSTDYPLRISKNERWAILAPRIDGED